MAEFKVEVVKLENVNPHPNADRLDVIPVFDYNVVNAKGKYKEGDTAIYIPVQAVLPDNIIEDLNLKGKLAGSKKNRVKEVKLRGIFSEGLLYPNKDNLPVGTDVTENLGIKKYEPEVPKSLRGEVFFAGLENVIKFDIQNIQKYPNVFKEGENVVFTEKLHGTCHIAGCKPLSDLDERLEEGRLVICSKGLLSKGLGFKHNDANSKNVYLRAAFKNKLPEILKTLSDRYGKMFFLLGEVLGVQDFKYGLSANDIDYRVFGAYTLHKGQKVPVNSNELDEICNEFGLNRVPVLYQGKFSKEVLKKYTNGKETLSGNEEHIREGIVITSEKERYHEGLGRVILKSVSEDYKLRKNGTEYN